MTRDQGIDVLWSAMMMSLPVGSDMPNTREDLHTAMTALAVFSTALEALGVTLVEQKDAQRRWEERVAA